MKYFVKKVTMWVGLMASNNNYASLVFIQH
jgi:hypothetical protein